MKHRPAPALRDARQRRIPVLHASGQYDPLRGRATAVGQLKNKTVAAALALEHVAVEQLHARVSGELFTPGGVKGGGRSTVLAEEACFNRPSVERSSNPARRCRSSPASGGGVRKKK